MSQKIALISVYNKDGVLDLAKGLEKSNVRILSTGGTKRIIEEAGFKVEDVSAITGKSSILQGRVKTLHQSVHGGILARDNEKDDQDLRNEAIAKIDYVICNLYPFSDTIQKVNCTVEEAVEEIDIGGVTLLRAAAKNHERVTVLCDPCDYHDFLTELGNGSGGITESSRQKFCVKAFTHVAEYDNAIAGFFRKSYMEREQYLSLRYGVNPHQSPASMSAVSGGALPFKVLCGAPGMVNMLDALNAFPLVKELEKACNLPAAASFKHCSPAGAAVGVPLTKEELEVNMVFDIDGIESSGLAQAYARARGADRMSSFGDFIALSSEVDLPTAKIISREVSDGVIAPSYSSEALGILSKKKGGKYLILQMNKDYEPPASEKREIYGIQLEQRRNNVEISPSKTFNTIIRPKDSSPLPQSALRDLTVATLALKYTQSNSVCYALNGQVIGLGAGQQSRIHCTRLAGDKADNWWMRFHSKTRGLQFKKGIKRADKSNAIDMLCSGQDPRTDNSEKVEYEAKFEEVPQPFSVEERQEWLEKFGNVVCSSDAFFPFTDNIYRAARSGVKYVAAPTGSQMDQAVFNTCEELGIVFIEQSVRLFHH